MTAPDATGQPDGDRLREALAAALEGRPLRFAVRSVTYDLANYLLPLVREHTERIAAARAADALLAVERDLSEWVFSAVDPRELLRVKARALLRAAHTTTERTD